MMNDKLGGMDLEDISQLLNTIEDMVAMESQTSKAPEEGVEADELIVDLDELRERGFWDTQIHEVELGLEQNLPVQRFAKDCFNWMQMKEIRLGLLHGVNTDFYDNPLYSATQMKEIRLGLEYGLDVSGFADLILSASDMKKRRMELLAKAYGTGTVRFGKTIVDEDTGIEIRISEDCMSAFMQVPSDCVEELTVKSLTNLLENNEIAYGMIESNLHKIIEDEVRDSEMKVATGFPVKEGKSGWFELFFRNDLPESPKLLENDRVDYTNVTVAEMVDPGIKLAQYHKSEDGHNGITVLGFEIEAGVGHELPPLTGEGIARDEEEEVYYATTQGYVYYDEEESTLNVRKIYIINEDANCYNGNIEFDGTIYVKGSINDLTVLSASGDVVVEGFVGNATIYAGGNAILKGGMNAGGHGTLTAGGKVMGKFFEAVTIRAKGSIEGNYFLNCDMETDDRVIARGSKSRIMGGSICAAVGVDSPIIGNCGRKKTTIAVGNYHWIDDRIKQQQALLKELEGELIQLEEGRAKLRQMLGDDVMGGNSIYEKTCIAIHTQETQYARVEKEIERLKEVRKSAAAAFVNVSLELQEGVNITVNGNVKEIAADIHGITLMKNKTRRRTQS
jgi:uncharacterized protein (DUF342 family)